MIGFCPYFLHENSSAGMSAILLLIAGTLVTFFTLFFLLLEQWHLPPPEPECLPEMLSEGSCSWHRFLYGTLEIGGFPADEAGPDAGAMNIDVPSFPFETLPSPVIADDMKEELDDTLKLSFANSISETPLELGPRMLGRVKSRVKLCLGCAWRKLAGDGCELVGAWMGVGARGWLRD